MLAVSASIALELREHLVVDSLPNSYYIFQSITVTMHAVLAHKPLIVQNADKRHIQSSMSTRMKIRIGRTTSCALTGATSLRKGVEAVPHEDETTRLGRRSISLVRSAKLDESWTSQQTCCSGVVSSSPHGLFLHR